MSTVASNAHMRQNARWKRGEGYFRILVLKSAMNHVAGERGLQRLLQQRAMSLATGGRRIQPISFFGVKHH